MADTPLSKLSILDKERLLKLAREKLAINRAAAQSIQRVDRDKPLQLSWAQQRLWFLDQFDRAAGAAYHVSSALRVLGRLNREALQAALDQVVARHECLRATFASVDGVPMQTFAPEHAGFELLDHDLSSLDPAAQAQAIAEWGSSEVLAPFDLATGPLIRGRLLRLSKHEHVLLVTLHHIISDAWSTTIFTREISALYAAFAQGRADPLLPLTVQYADYASWQRQRLQGEGLQTQLDFWKEHLTGAPELLTLPTDRPRPAAQSHVGDRLDVRLPSELTVALRALSKRHGVTLFMTLLAAWSVLLSRLSDQKEVVIGTSVGNRQRPEIEPLIGFFLNILALRIEVGAELSVAELLAQIKATTLKGYAHQELPFDQVVEALQPARSLSHSPLFQVMLSLNNTPGDGTLSFPDLTVEVMDTFQRTIHFDLELVLNDTGKEVSGNLTYATDLFNRSTVERFVECFITLLKGMVAEETSKVRHLSLLSVAERDKVVAKFNATQKAYPHDQLVHCLFEEQAAVRPDEVALICADESLSYGELNRRANQMAHRLLGLGVKPDDRVAICVERSPEMVIGLLGILKAGAAYVPLDPVYPTDRLAYMLEDCAPIALLTQAALYTRLPVLESAQMPVIMLEQAGLASYPAHNPKPKDLGLASRHLAYVIYTSGSTGRPKGAMVSHQNLANYLAHAGSHYLCEDICGALIATPLGFDATVTTLMTPWLVGKPMVLLTDDSHECLVQLLAYGQKREAWLFKVTPSHLDALANLAAAQLSDTRHIFVVGGEQLHCRTLKQFHACVLPKAMVVNEYGPTEATVGCSSFVNHGELLEGDAVPIGRPIANTQIYILDRHRQPLPVGVAGEIYIGGAGVARGYLNRPELTAERFIEDPFAAVAGARLYKTGDLGRWLPDGTLEYLGRNDFQVKIRGFRIELGEIESRLLERVGVHEAVVVAREDEAGDKRLVAYLVARKGAELSVAELRESLSRELVEYMVPSAFVMLPALPLTPNGKLDRKALPAPDQAAVLSRQYEAPVSETEQAIAAIWQELLGLERVGRHDHFFELGGHSLMAVQLVARLRETVGVEFALSEIFAQPTLEGMARALSKADQTSLPPIEIIDRGEILPLSWAQQRLWFLYQFDHTSHAAYHIPAALRLSGKLDRQALQGALDLVVARHESLRTTFVSLEGVPRQIIGPEQAGFQLIDQDLRLLDESARVEAVAELSAQEMQAPFDLTAGPLIRGRLLRLGEDEHILLVTQNHIITDGWSIGVLVNEVSALYAALSQGRTDTLPALPIQYADYAIWQRRWLQGEALQKQLDYWREHLAGAPALLELPTDRPRGAVQSYAGANVPVQLSAELTAALQALSQRHGITLFMTLLAGWSVLLSRLSGQDDLVIGTPVANRQRAEIEPLIGFFVNTLALRLDLRNDPSVEQLLAQVKLITLGAFAHQDLPFEQVVEALQPVRSLSHSPLFQVMLSLNNVPEHDALALPELVLSPLESVQRTAHFDLSLSLTESANGLVGTVAYVTELFDRATVERLAVYLVTLFKGLVADDTSRVSHLPLMPAAEREKVVVEFNVTQAAYAQDLLVHGLFEEQAATRPDAVALVFGDESLSYGELNRRANQVAHRLLGLGVKPDDRVAICTERSLEMMIGLLGIMKAGAAYVPLDPVYPTDRLAYMLEDCAAAALLTQAGLHARLPALQLAAIPVVMLEDADLAAQPGHNPDSQALGLSSHHMAYVIYTSGSTGQPKGVMVEHRHVLSLICAHVAMCGLKPGRRVMQFASYSFDNSVAEIFPALSVGMTIVLRPADLVAPDETFTALLQAHDIDIVDLPTAFWHRWSQEIRSGRSLPGPGLKLVVVGGEKLERPYLEHWLTEPATHGCDLLNTYGPTETTVTATSIKLDRSSLLSMNDAPIGRPIANTRIYILDRHGQPVPIGVAGEIHIGGTSVARGYLNRPELTAERFIEDPFAATADARLYKTGDLGRWLPDGTVEYLGRNDFQVKIRGFRIELGEVESRLLGCAGVREALVVVREDAESDKRLVAYVVAQEGRELSVAELRESLLRELAEYMVPSAFVMLPALPLTPNGKLDRKALPAPDQAAVLSRAYEAPANETEQTIAAIWQELLGLERVGRHDHFFELGGHSLMVIGMIERLRLRGLGANAHMVFRAPIVSSLAALIADASGLAAVGQVPANLIPAEFAEPMLSADTEEFLI